MTKIVNLTPHTVNLIKGDSLRGPIDSRGVARATEHLEPLAPISWDVFGDCGLHVLVPCTSKSFGAVTGLPAPENDTLYIVSQIVADACPDRTDLIVPSDIVRDPSGQVSGCRAFSRRATTAPKASPATKLYGHYLVGSTVASEAAILRHEHRASVSSLEAAAEFLIRFSADGREWPMADIRFHFRPQGRDTVYTVTGGADNREIGWVRTQGCEMGMG